MNDQHDYTVTFTVGKSSQVAFDAINDPRRWWSQAIEGVGDLNAQVEELLYLKGFAGDAVL